MMRMPVLFLLCLAIGGLAGSGCSPSPEDTMSQAGSDGAFDGLPLTGLEVGSPFPSVALRPVEGGTPVTIADFAGTKVVLHVFASW